MRDRDTLGISKLGINVRGKDPIVPVMIIIVGVLGGYDDTVQPFTIRPPVKPGVMIRTGNP